MTINIDLSGALVESWERMVEGTPQTVTRLTVGPEQLAEERVCLHCEAPLAAGDDVARIARGLNNQSVASIVVYLHKDCAQTFYDAPTGDAS